MEPIFQPLRANLGQQVYQHLFLKICRMEFEPGTALGISELAEQLGVSRSPVRDALMMLVAEGLLEQNAAGGYRVIQFDRKYIDDIFVFRRALEATSVRLCVLNIRPERVENLISVWEALRAADPENPDTIERHLIADSEFHQTLAEMSNNALLKQALDRIIMIAQLIRRWQYAGGISHRQFQYTANEHLLVLNTLLEGDPDAAVQALDAHLKLAQERSLARLDGRERVVPQFTRRRRANRKEV